MYSENYYEQEHMNEFIENEMQLTKEFALKRLSLVADFKTHVSNDSFIYKFIQSWHDSVPAVANLAYEMDLDKVHFLALMNDFDEFKEEYLKKDREEFYG